MGELLRSCPLDPSCVLCLRSFLVYLLFRAFLIPVVVEYSCDSNPAAGLSHMRGIGDIHCDILARLTVSNLCKSLRFCIKRDYSFTGGNPLLLFLHQRESFVVVLHQREFIVALAGIILPPAGILFHRVGVLRFE